MGLFLKKTHLLRPLSPLSLSSFSVSLHAWAGALGCYLEMLDKLQKQAGRTVGPSLAASFEPLAHSQHVANLHFFSTFLIWNFYSFVFLDSFSRSSTITIVLYIVLKLIYILSLLILSSKKWLNKLNEIAY